MVGALLGWARPTTEYRVRLVCADLRDENTNISFRSTLLGVGDA